MLPEGGNACPLSECTLKGNSQCAPKPGVENGSIECEILEVQCEVGDEIRSNEDGSNLLYEEQCPVDCVLGDWSEWHIGANNEEEPGLSTSGHWGNAFQFTDDQQLLVKREQEVIEDAQNGGSCPSLKERTQVKPWTDHCNQVLHEKHVVGEWGDCVEDNAGHGVKSRSHSLARCADQAFVQVNVEFTQKQRC